jgi:hypothetical protein
MGFLIMLSRVEFSGLGPRECADMIQAQEAQRAKEWAGDT